MKLPFSEILKRNTKKLENEKKRVEIELKTINKSDAYQADNISNQEVEIESKSEDMEITENNDSMRQTLLSYLSQIRTALGRIKKKKYGVCARCGKPIDPERLSANPAALYCLSCAQLLETTNGEA